MPDPEIISSNLDVCNMPQIPIGPSNPSQTLVGFEHSNIADPENTSNKPYLLEFPQIPDGLENPCLSDPVNTSNEQELNPLDSPAPLQTLDMPEKSMYIDTVSKIHGEAIECDKESDINDVLPHLVGAGLSNLGNTCFLNAVLQCFTNMVPFVEGLRSHGHDHKSQCPSGSDEFCLLCNLFEHIENSLASPGGLISPTTLVENLSYFSSCFQRYQQEDAHEFLQCLLDKLDNCFLDSKTSLEDNVVKQVFGGRLVSKLKCCNCNCCSESFESIIDLSLEIKDVVTLPHALESFTTLERIGDPESKFTCENCKEDVSVEKQFMLDQVPSVAAFHLKRFKTDGIYVEKIDKHVAYPLELDLKPYISDLQDSNAELKYDLYAIVVHAGYSSNSGHYFSFIRSSPEIWYQLDDSQVTRVDEDYVLSQEAYILFYTRQGTPWISSLIQIPDICADSNILGSSPKSVLDLDGNYPNVEKINTPKFNSPIKVNDCVNLSSSMSSERVHRMIETSHIDYIVIEKSAADMEPRTSHIDYIVMEPRTPLRPSSPDIYADEPREDIIPISFNHPLKQFSRKKEPLNCALEDAKRMEACRLVKKCMPSSRQRQFLSAMMGSKSEGFSTKRSKRRMPWTPDGSQDHTCACKKSEHSPIRRRVGVFP